MTSDTDSDLPLDLVDHDAPPTKPPEKETRKRRLILIPLIFALIFIGGVLGLYFQPPGMQAFFAAAGLQPGGGSDDPFALPADVDLPEDVAATLQPTDVVGLARLLPRGDVSVVAPPFGAGDARIERILVSIGDRVAEGQEVAVLDNLATLQSAVSTAEATVALREANLMQTRQSVTISIAEAQASVEEAEAAAAAARSDLQRTQSLFERGVTTQAVLDQVQAAATQATQAAARARATLARYDSADPDLQPDVIVAQRNLDAARIDLDRTIRDLSRASVIAPIAGTVLDIDARPGQSAGGSTNGIMQIGNTDQMMAEIEVYQDRIGDVAEGQPVELIAEALGTTLYGEVERIGLQVGRQEIVSSDTAANTDARVVEVIVALDARSSGEAARYTNLEVIARIDTRGAGAAQ